MKLVSGEWDYFRIYTLRYQIKYIVEWWESPVYLVHPVWPDTFLCAITCFHLSIFQNISNKLKEGRIHPFTFVSTLITWTFQRPNSNIIHIKTHIHTNYWPIIIFTIQSELLCEHEKLLKQKEMTLGPKNPVKGRRITCNKSKSIDRVYLFTCWNQR